MMKANTLLWLIIEFITKFSVSLSKTENRETYKMHSFIFFGFFFPVLNK